MIILEYFLLFKLNYKISFFKLILLLKILFSPVKKVKAKLILIELIILFQKENRKTQHYQDIIA